MADSAAKRGATESLCQNGFRGYFADSAGLVPSQGKRAVEHMENSLVHSWKSTRRPVPMPGAAHYEKPEGIRQVPEPPRTIHAIRERRHLRQLESKEEFSDRPQGVGIVHREGGLRALDQPAQEVDLSAEMARKARPLDLWSKRNGIACASQGDKSYRHPEYNPGFYAAGELVVGSSFTRGPQACVYPKQLAAGHSGLILQVGAPMVTYKEKEQSRLQREARSEVEELTRDWERSVLKECDETYNEPLDSDDES
jgi:hypothetical protein